MTPPSDGIKTKGSCQLALRFSGILSQEVCLSHLSMHAQSTLEPSGGSNASMASLSNGINTFQVGERRDAPPSGLLPQVWYQHAQAKVTSPCICPTFTPCHQVQGNLWSLRSGYASVDSMLKVCSRCLYEHQGVCCKCEGALLSHLAEAESCKCACSIT